MKEAMRAVIYGRVSTEEQAENNTSLKDQRKRGLLYAEARELLPVKTLEDAGISGTLYEGRPALTEALRIIESGLAQVLIVTKIDRLARKTKVLLDIAERVSNVGGMIVTCDGMELGGTPIGRLMLTLLGAIAEFERDNIRERMLRGKQCRADQGVQPMRGKSPYGYHVILHSDVAQGLYPAGSEGTYVVLADQAEWVKQIYERYDGGQPLRQIAAWMNETAAPTPKQGKHWYASTIRDILSNPVFKGSAAFGRRRTISGEHLSYRSDPTRKLKAGSRTNFKPEEEWTLIPVPQIIDAALWERCQERLRANKEEKQAQHGGNPGRKHLLTGMVRCPCCGWRMGGYAKKWGPERTTQYYTCSQNEDCPGRYKSYRGDLLNSIAVQALMHLAQHPASVRDAYRAYDEHVRERSQKSADGQEHRRLTGELEKINKEIDATRRAMIQAMQVGLREEDFLKDLSRLASARTKIEEQLQAMEVSSQSLPEMEASKTNAEKVSAIAASMVKVFEAEEEEFSTADKQALLTRIIDFIKPTEEGAEITLRSETVQCIKMAPFVKVR